jgi:hypothetical protein
MSVRSSAIRSATAMAAMVAIAATAAFGSAAAQAPSTQPGEAVDAVAAEAPACQRLTDFNEDDSAGWFIVNDGVMGGRSDGGGFIDESVLRFEGTVVTAGGGFTSVRRQLDGDELAGSSRVEMRVRPDGRTYGVTLDDAAQYQGRFVSHRADFEIGPVEDDGWAIASVDYDDLIPSVFGILVDAPAFDPSTAREFGIIIADGIDGDFVLDIDWIDACP